MSFKSWLNKPYIKKYSLLIAVSALTLTLNLPFIPFTGHLRIFVQDGLAATLSSVSIFWGKLQRKIYGWHHASALIQENGRLKQQVLSLSFLHHENRQLKEAANFVTPYPIAILSTRRILNHVATSHTLVIQAGKGTPIEEGYPVVADQGILGRIEAVGYLSSCVTLISHPLMRIPAISLNTGAHAIVAGDGHLYPLITHWQGDQPPVPGDTFVTSGTGGVFPAGKNIGIVIRDGDGTTRIKPWYDSAFIDIVYVLEPVTPAAQP